MNPSGGFEPPRRRASAPAAPLAFPPGPCPFASRPGSGSAALSVFAPAALRTSCSRAASAVVPLLAPLLALAPPPLATPELGGVGRGLTPLLLALWRASATEAGGAVVGSGVGSPRVLHTIATSARMASAAAALLAAAPVWPRGPWLAPGVPSTLGISRGRVGRVLSLCYLR